MYNYSRPSIDLTFFSIADTFKKNVLGIIVTGANKDGAHGMSSIHKKGGLTIAQDPKECSAPYMPQSAIELHCIDYVLNIEQINTFILKSCK
jgi:two-component system chemotaxis response regulator CheB